MITHLVYTPKGIIVNQSYLITYKQMETLNADYIFAFKQWLEKDFDKEYKELLEEG